jgi:CheY-like chemotaxis protein
VVDRDLLIALVAQLPQVFLIAIALGAVIRFRQPISRFLEKRDTSLSVLGFSIDLKASDIAEAMRVRSEQTGMLSETDPTWVGTGQIADRARRLEGQIGGRTILWVDDHPEGNRIERRLLRRMGVFVETVRTNDEAVIVLEDATERMSLIISDIKRDNGSSGLALVKDIATRPGHPPIVLYVGRPSEDRAIPPDVFGVTSRPDALLNLVMDALDRQPPR